jgi:hypothetical protein
MNRCYLVPIWLLAACSDGVDVASSALRDGAASDTTVGDTDAPDAHDMDDGSLESVTETAPDLTADGPGEVAPETREDSPSDSPSETVVAPPDGSSPDQPLEVPPTEDEMGSAPVSVMAGGLLEHAKVRVVIPAGTPMVDGVVTVLRRIPADDLPNRAEIVGNVYDFGPIGASFRAPIELRLPLATAVPADREAVVAWLHEPGKHWVPVPSMLSEGRVTGYVTHLGTFAVLLVGKTDVCPYGGACGGELEGTWQYSAGCGRGQPPRMIPCGTGAPIYQRQSFMVGGTLTVMGNSYTLNRMTRVWTTLFHTPSCLMAMSQAGTAYESCDALQAAFRRDRNPNWSCAGSVQQGCSCFLSSLIPVGTEAGTVAVQGMKIVFTKQGADEPGPAVDFCVRGRSLSMRNADGSVHSATRAD